MHKQHYLSFLFKKLVPRVCLMRKNNCNCSEGKKGDVDKQECEFSKRCRMKRYLQIFESFLNTFSYPCLI